MDIQINSDGRTVWVNADDGMCIGRFSRFGIDLHNDFATQSAGGNQCLDCTHTRPELGDWKRFQDGIHAAYSVIVGDYHMPNFLKSEGRQEHPFPQLSEIIT